jgi:hypothetical protein
MLFSLDTKITQTVILKNQYMRYSVTNNCFRHLLAFIRVISTDSIQYETVKDKCKVVPVHAMNARRGS